MKFHIPEHLKGRAKLAELVRQSVRAPHKVTHPAAPLLDRAITKDRGQDNERSRTVPLSVPGDIEIQPLLAVIRVELERQGCSVTTHNGCLVSVFAKRARSVYLSQKTE